MHALGSPVELVYWFSLPLHSCVMTIALYYVFSVRNSSETCEMEANVETKQRINIINI